MPIPLDRLIPFDADLDLASPNHGSRGGKAVQMIVLHATADNGSEIGAESWMRNPAAEVSAHLHIRRDGTVVRLVDDRRRAWHAGRSEWPGVQNVNDASLGWEIANRNDGVEAYTPAQYAAVARLLRFYLPQGIDRGDVVSHAQIAPGRKTDPRGWDWSRMWALFDGIGTPAEAEPVLPPPPVPRLENTVHRMPAPLAKVSPLRRPVTQVAREGETTEAFLARFGAALPPLLRPLWSLLIGRIRARLEGEVDEALDRVFGE